MQPAAKDRGATWRPLAIMLAMSTLAALPGIALAQAVSAEPADEPSAPVPPPLASADDTADSADSPADTPPQADEDAATASTTVSGIEHYLPSTTEADSTATTPASESPSDSPSEGTSDAASDSDPLPLHLPARGQPGAGSRGSANLGSMTITLPPGSAALDGATVQRVVARLVDLHLLGTPADAQDASLLANAIRSFQSGAGIAASGTLDRDTLGLLLAR